MLYNWQKPDWPKFTWDHARLAPAERRFLLNAGEFLGLAKHLTAADRDQITVEAMSGEALTTSEIEGELLNRDSLQSSIRRALGLASDQRRVRPAEQGVSELLVRVYRGHAKPLDDAELFAWHRLLMKGHTGLRDIGRYRTSIEPMQVVSGQLYEPKVHFEAPPSKRVPREMRGFLKWFTATAPDGRAALPALTRAGVAHLYFESIHPFEDGNGRIGRAIAEKTLAQALGQPALTALSTTILLHRRNYYRALEIANKRNEITDWLAWFAGIVLEAQLRTRNQVEFLLDKTRFLDTVRKDLNERQLKVLLRMLREGPDGFQGALSAGKYATIAKTSPATARRDLGELVDRSALLRTGEKKYTRYHLPIALRSTPRITINAAGEVITQRTAESGAA